MDPIFLKYAVRLTHTAAAALVVGGAALLWAQLAGLAGWRRIGGRPPPSALGAAAVYEWGFWGAAGLLAATGVGNLAVFGDSLPGTQTDWGGRLLLKLAGVAVLLLFSAWRTLVVASGAPPPAALYGATSLLSLGVLGLAVWLAHP